MLRIRIKSNNLKKLFLKKRIVPYKIDNKKLFHDEIDDSTFDHIEKWLKKVNSYYKNKNYASKTGHFENNSSNSIKKINNNVYKSTSSVEKTNNNLIFKNNLNKKKEKSNNLKQKEYTFFDIANSIVNSIVKSQTNENNINNTKHSIKKLQNFSNYGNKNNNIDTTKLYKNITQDNKNNNNITLFQSINLNQNNLTKNIYDKKINSNFKKYNTDENNINKTINSISKMNNVFINGNKVNNIDNNRNEIKNLINIINKNKNIDNTNTNINKNKNIDNTNTTINKKTNELQGLEKKDNNMYFSVDKNNTSHRKKNDVSTFSKEQKSSTKVTVTIKRHYQHLYMFYDKHKSKDNIPLNSKKTLLNNNKSNMNSNKIPYNGSDVLGTQSHFNKNARNNKSHATFIKTPNTVINRSHVNWNKKTDNNTHNRSKKFNYKHQFVRGSFLHKMNALFNKWKFSNVKIKRHKHKPKRNKNHDLIDPIYNVNDCLINYRKTFTKYFFFKKKIVDSDFGTYVFSPRRIFFNRIYNFFWLNFLHYKSYNAISHKYKHKYNNMSSIEHHPNSIENNPFFINANLLNSFFSLINMLISSNMYINKKKLNVLVNYNYEIIKRNILIFFNDYKYKNNINNILNYYYINRVRNNFKKHSNKKFRYFQWKSFFPKRKKSLRVRSKNYIIKMIFNKRAMHVHKKSYRFRKKYYFARKNNKSFNEIELWRNSRDSYFYNSENILLLNYINKLYNYSIFNNLTNWYSYKDNNMNPVFLYSQYRKYVIHNIDYNRLFEKNMNFSFKNTDSRVTIQKLSKIHFLNRIYLYKDKINYYYYYTNKKVRLFNYFNKNNIFDFFSSNFFTKNLYLPYKANEKNRHLPSKVKHLFNTKDKLFNNYLKSITSNHKTDDIFMFSHKFLTIFFILYTTIRTSSSLLIIISNFYKFSSAEFILWKLNFFISFHNIHFFARDFLIYLYKNNIFDINNIKMYTPFSITNKHFNSFSITNKNSYKINLFKHQMITNSYYLFSFSEWLFYSSRIYNISLPLFKLRKDKVLFVSKKKQILKLIRKKLMSTNYKFHFMKYLNALRINDTLLNIRVKKKEKIHFMHIYKHFFYYFLLRLFSTKNTFYKKMSSVWNDHNILNIIEKHYNSSHHFSVNVSNKITLRSNDISYRTPYMDNGKIIILLLRYLISNLHNIKKKKIVSDVNYLFVIASCLQMLYSRESRIGYFNSDRVNSFINHAKNFKLSNLKSYISNKTREYSLIFKNSYSIFMHFINRLKSSIIDYFFTNTFSTYKNYTVFFDMKNNNIFYEVYPYQKDYYIKDIINKSVDFLTS